MTATSYPPPVASLLNHGSCLEIGDEWPDYPALLRLTSEHVPELIRMATDESLNNGDPEGLEIWAPVHAWRALGQLKAEAAIAPLLGLLRNDESDWASDELPTVMAMMGAAAVPELARYLEDPRNGEFARISAVQCLNDIVQKHPDLKDECLGVAAGQLTLYKQNEPALNGFLVDLIMDHHGVAHESVMRDAFADECVDLSIVGDWEDVQVGMGLIEPSEEYLQRKLESQTLLESLFSPMGRVATNYAKQKSLREREKSRKKMAKISRKKNRRQK